MARAWLSIFMPALLLPCCVQFGLEDAPPTSADGSLLDGSDGTTTANTAPAPTPTQSRATLRRDGATDCSPACKGTAGPCGVPVPSDEGTYCVDATEVTVAHYKEFLSQKASTTVPAAAPCPSFAITQRAYLDDDMPVTNVTWCEARAYCAWAGKQLCGTIEGTPLATDRIPTQTSAWYHACTKGGTGHERIGATPCRLESHSPLPSGKTCRGAYPGLFDMPGNVWEWVDATTGANAFFVGNGYSQPTSPDTCATASNTPVTNPVADVGFRCCAF